MTCQAQPALGMVYKVCEFKGGARIKVSEEPGKTTIPGAKSALRVRNSEGEPIFDLLCLKDEFQSILENPASVNAVYDRLTKQVAVQEPFDASKHNQLDSLSTDLFIEGSVVAEQPTL